MTDATKPLFSDQDALAAELALGLLDGEELLHAERLRRTDPSFDAAVRDWEETAAEWASQLPPETPPAALWDRIAENIPQPAAANPLAAAPVTGSPGIWKPLALAASLAMVVFASLWALGPSPPTDQVPVPTPPASYGVAQITGEDSQVILTAVYHPDDARMLVQLTDIEDESRVPQLWLVDQAGAAHSLGFGRTDAAQAIALSPAQRAMVEQGGAIAVSLEQPAAQPHQAPSDVLGASRIVFVNEERASAIS